MKVRRTVEPLTRSEYVTLVKIIQKERYALNRRANTLPVPEDRQDLVLDSEYLDKALLKITEYLAPADRMPM